MEEEKLIEFLKKKGIKNPEDPTQKEIKKLLGLISKSNNETEKEFYKSYFTSMTTAAKGVIDGLKHLANAHISKEYIDSVNKVIDQLNKDYDKATSDEEKEKVYNKIVEQLDRIKQEAKEHRDYLKQLGLYAVGTVVLVGGVAVTVRNKELGGQIVRKGLEAFKI